MHRRLHLLLQPKAGLSGRRPPERHLDAPVRHELHVFGLQGQLQAGGPAPGLRHADQQLLSPLLILPVALGEDPWMGEGLITAAGPSPGEAADSGGARPLRTAQRAQGWGEDPRVTHGAAAPEAHQWLSVHTHPRAPASPPNCPCPPPLWTTPSGSCCRPRLPRCSPGSGYPRGATVRLWMVLPRDPQHAATQADESKGPEIAQASGRGLSVCSFHINF